MSDKIKVKHVTLYLLCYVLQMSDYYETTITSVGLVNDAQPNPHPIITTMANMMNYLTVSLYQGQFTYKHEQAWARLNSIYYHISKTSTPTEILSLDIIKDFHNNIETLWFVTETDDPDYDTYMKELRSHISAAEKAARIQELIYFR